MRRVLVGGPVPGIAHERPQIGTIRIELQAGAAVARTGDDATPPRGVFHLQSVGIEQERVAGIEVLRRSEEHTSELQSPCNLVCRLLLEKKKKKYNIMLSTSQDVHLTSPMDCCSRT